MFTSPEGHTQVLVGYFTSNDTFEVEASLHRRKGVSDSFIFPVHLTSHQVSRVWGNWGEYTLVPKWREWALAHLGVGHIDLGVDLFATPWSSAAPLFITKEMDAFSFSWGALQPGGSTLLWANPPFAILEKVVEKLARDPCHIAMVTPHWEDKPWWEMLLKLPHQRICLPPRYHLFYGAFRKSTLPQPAWRTVVWLIDTRKSKESPQNFREPQDNIGQKGLEDLKKEVEKIPAVQWTHGFQGGKPTQRGTPHKPFEDTFGKTTRDCETQTTFVGRSELATNASEPVSQGLDVATSSSTFLGTPHSEEVESSKNPPAFLRGGIKTFGEETSRGSPTGALEKVLRVKVVITTPDNTQFQALALVDTGAEVNLIRKGLLPEHCFKEAKVRLRLVAANNQQIPGGAMEVTVQMVLPARDFETRERFSVTTPTTLYQSSGIGEDIILAYRWMAERSVVVDPRQHGMAATVDKIKVWIPGETGLRQRANARLPSQPMHICAVPVQEGQHKKKPRALDLFCGRKSAATILERQGFQVETLDIDSKRNTSVRADILTWKYKT